jgi:hypothetical protein
MAALGALMGFETFRLASRARKPLPFGGTLYLLAAAAVGAWLAQDYGLLSHLVGERLWHYIFGATFALTLQLGLREQVLRRDRIPPLVPVLWSIGHLCAIALMNRKLGSPFIVVCMGVASWIAMWIADTWLVYRIARLRAAGLLAPEPGLRFQFSLRSLMIFVLALNVWLTGLVLLCRV